MRVYCNIRNIQGQRGDIFATLKCKRNHFTQADKHFILRVSLPKKRRTLDMHELMRGDDSIEFHCDGREHNA